jgi:hypothetical protein
MNERDMEDLIAEYPDDFFPNRRFELKGRQQSFAKVGRFDLLFEDEFKTVVLMELKAVTAKYEVATQLAKYKDELTARGEKHILMWLVAPHIPPSVREFMDHIGIEYNEIHFGEFRRVAEHHGFSIRSETEPASIEGADQSAIPRSEARRSRGSVGLKVPTGARVTLASAFRWKAFGNDLELENCKEFDADEFRKLVDAFQDAVPSKRNAGLVEDLKRFGGNPCSSHWLHSSNRSLLRWVTTSRYKAAVPFAFALWKYLFGEPVPTWYVWNQSTGYAFDPGAWRVWFASLHQDQ